VTGDNKERECRFGCQFVKEITGKWFQHGVTSPTNHIQQLSFLGL